MCCIEVDFISLCMIKDVIIHKTQTLGEGAMGQSPMAIGKRNSLALPALLAPDAQAAKKVRREGKVKSPPAGFLIFGM